MFLARKDEKEMFQKNLFDFLASRNKGNLKVPQIGGKELDLHELYHAVVKRGGAQNVTVKKLWKEIVNEFDLPPSCTSASFTLKNHYEKYLLTYEQKFFFGRSDDDMIKELGSVRQKRSKPQKTWRENINYSHIYSSDSSLKANLIKHYGERFEKGENIEFMRRSKLVPFTGEMRRIMLAFESHLQEEIRFSLNHLLMYSCSDQPSIELEKFEMVFIGMMGYLEHISGNIPYLFKDKAPTLHKESKINVIENYNFEIYDLMSEKKGGGSPLEILKNDRKFKVTMRYEEVSPKEILEQIKMIFQIIRNLIFVKDNDAFIYSKKGIFMLIVDYFFSCNDPEVLKNCLEIMSVLCKHIILNELPKKKSQELTDRIICYLESSYHEEYEAALESLHNLMLSQENEMNIESLLPKYLGSLVKLLMSSSFDAIASSLEILCYLSDLKMSTRLLLAKQQNLIPRLIALIAGNFNQVTEKNAKLSAMIISNICITQSAKKFFIPYEKDIFCLASCDDTVSEILSGVLQELENVETEPLEESQRFYEEMGKFMSNISSEFLGN